MPSNAVFGGLALFTSAGAMIERARNKYTTEELAAWAIKPFWGLLESL